MGPGGEGTKLPAAFVEVLKAERETLNGRFAMLQRGGTRIDGAALLSHLRHSVAPLVGSLAGVSPRQKRELVVSLFDVSLDLFSASLLGPDAKSPWIQRVWEELLPAAAHLLARNPLLVAGSLCNAIFHISRQPGTRPLAWLERMRRVASSCEREVELLEVGKVAAWQAGMVQYREGALEAAGRLRTSLAAAALGMPDTTVADRLTAVLAGLREHRWLTVDTLAAASAAETPVCVGEAGAFAGWGGLFLRPPKVRWEGGFLVTDGRAQWEMLADAYGTWFHRCDAAPIPRPARAAASAISIDPQGTIRWGAGSLSVPYLSRASSFACDGETLAVTIPSSHHVFLFGAPGSSA